MASAMNSVTISITSTADDASRLLTCGKVSVDSEVHDGFGRRGACGSQQHETQMPSRCRGKAPQAACHMGQGSGDETAENRVTSSENKAKKQLVSAWCFPPPLPLPLPLLERFAPGVPDKVERIATVSRTKPSADHSRYLARDCLAVK